MSKGVYKRGQSWYMNITVGGNRINRKAGNSKEEAEALVNAIMADCRISKLRKKTGSTIDNGQLTDFLNKKTKSTSGVPYKIPEKYLEDYLEKNIRKLDKDLTYSGRQIFVPTGRVDIVAYNKSDELIYIELKTDAPRNLAVDELCGQVSRYFNGMDSRNKKLYMVIPAANIKTVNKICTSLSHWIREGKIYLYQFDYAIYRKSFIFEKIDLQDFDK